MAHDEKKKKAIAEENKKIKQLRFCVDLTYAMIAQGDYTLDDAYLLIESLKKVALTLFPGKGETFDLIYGARFKHLIMEKYQLH
ncbi:MAG: hypothetical protein DSY91_01685 [Deltaproteobacteria bacterium]|nr:MAG: hypothetical protein DSY91_01685 [Deltaproteobacteria bacterium]